MDLDSTKRVAIAAAYQGGRILAAKLGRIARIEHKGLIDLVTEADRASERCIVDTIRHQFPRHGLLAEESGATRGSADGLWIIDPLDGTTNFAHGLPTCCVSIAFVCEEEVQIGVVLAPFSNELFVAVRGRGAYRNSRPIRVADTPKLLDSLLVTGFPYNVRDILEPTMQRFSRCLAASRGLRRLGSAALDLCYVAAGRFEAFWEENLKPWDTAAGALIVDEAGGRVTDFSNQRFHPTDSQTTLATNGRLHAAMLKLLDLKGVE